MTKPKNIAAIDIGSNAMRVAFAKLNSDDELKIYKNYRYPLRLGADVFKDKKVSAKKLQKTLDAFSEITFEMSKYKVESVRAVATSAVRNSQNKKKIIQQIFDLSDIEVEVIDGIKEAQIIREAVSKVYDLKNKKSLFIDIGGGSTEISIFKNKKLILTKSYELGTIRMLQLHSQRQVAEKVKLLAKQISKDILKSTDPLTLNFAVGTGGNLRRMGKLRKQVFHKPMTNITLKEIELLVAQIKPLSLKSRMEQYCLRKDRADVIIPAMLMIHQIMSEMSLNQIQLPRVGLKEGLLLRQLAKVKKLILPIDN